MAERNSARNDPVESALEGAIMPHGDDPFLLRSRRERPSRDELNAKRVLAPDLPKEADHFYRCSGCGQMVDRRRLGDVLHHEEPAHAPLPEHNYRVAFVEPMLPTLAEAPPARDDWQHELKHDGYRTQLLIDSQGVRTFTRRGYDWTSRYPATVTAATRLDCRGRYRRRDDMPGRAGPIRLRSFPASARSVCRVDHLNGLRPAAPQWPRPPPIAAD
jgi:hypothetical protein